MYYSCFLSTLTIPLKPKCIFSQRENIYEFGLNKFFFYITIFIYTSSVHQSILVTPNPPLYVCLLSQCTLHNHTFVLVKENCQVYAQITFNERESYQSLQCTQILGKVESILSLCFPILCVHKTDVLLRVIRAELRRKVYLSPYYVSCPQIIYCQAENP